MRCRRGLESRAAVGAASSRQCIGLFRRLPSISEADRDAPRRALSKPAAFVVLCKGLALKTELTAARLRELLHYDKATGFFWKRSPFAKKSVLVDGLRRVGKMNSTNGYVYVSADGRVYRAHRLAWLYVYGVWPTEQLDHKDRNRENNAIRNLRECNNAENSYNRGIRDDNTSGYIGVTWNRGRGKWQSQIKRGGNNKVLGLFECPREAYEEYKSAKKDIHVIRSGA